jgi:hypothetical protein
MKRAMISGFRGLSTGNLPEDCLLAAVRGPKDPAVIGVLGTVFVFNSSCYMVESYIICLLISDSVCSEPKAAPFITFSFLG